MAHNRINRALFALGALPYDWLTQREPWREHCRAMLAEIPAAGRPRWILDLGCGPGVSAIEMLHAGGDRAVGFDLSGPMLARARGHRARAGLDGRLDLVRGDALALPFADGTFDALTGHSFLYLLPDRAQALREMLRVLRPGGVLVLLEPAQGNAARAVVGMARSSTPTFAITVGLWRVVSGAIGRFSSDSLEATLAEAGFRDVQVRAEFGGVALQARAVRSAITG